MKHLTKWIIAGGLCGAIGSVSFAAGLRSTVTRGLQESSEGIARCSEKTASGVRKAGKDGLKVMSGTVSTFEREGKKVIRFIAS
jgi:hypothetical protein